MSRSWFEPIRWAIGLIAAGALGACASSVSPLEASTELSCKDDMTVRSQGDPGPAVTGAYTHQCFQRPYASWGAPYVAI
jgi:hypothetical protein